MLSIREVNVGKPIIAHNNDISSDRAHGKTIA